MSESTDAPSKSKNPEHYSFMDRDALAKYTTDTGKILPASTPALLPCSSASVHPDQKGKAHANPQIRGFLPNRSIITSH